MLVLSRDGDWLARLKLLAGRGGWSFESRAALTASGRTPPERSLAVLDRGLAGAMPKKAVSAMRVLCPGAAIALAFDAANMSNDEITAAVACGADEILAKSWPDAKLSLRLAALHDRSLAAQDRLSSGGQLKAERRAHRAQIKIRGRWKELPLDAGGFAILWLLLEREGELVARGELSAALAVAVGRELESGAVVRRLAALKKTLGSWPGAIETMRGGFYRLVPR